MGLPQVPELSLCPVTHSHCLLRTAHPWGVTAGKELQVAVCWGPGEQSVGSQSSPRACHCRCAQVPICSYTLVRGENLSLPMHLPFLPVYARVVGEGPGSQEPHADAVRNIGFNEVQNEAAAADMYGWCPHPPSPTLSQPCLLAPTPSHPSPDTQLFLLQEAVLSDF